jgi:DNA-binding NarL/FixJ family response regulator
MRVAVADDAVILREGLARLLEEAGFDVVGLAADGDTLLELVERTRPDVAIVDIRMPSTHTDEGLRAAKVIRERWPTIGILVLTQYVNTRYALELLSAGTDGAGDKHVKNILGALRLPQSPEDHRRVLAVITYLNSQ